MHELSKSINCNSCGGPLNYTLLKLCVCSYCGNTNKILDDGKTIIVNDVCKPKKLCTQEKKQKMSVGQIIMFVLCGIVVFTVIMHITRKKSWNDKQRQLI